MTRVTFFALLAAGVLSASLSRADVAVAPPPREIRPDGTRDPVPVAEAPKKEDPREVVDRIIKNSKAVGDKLAEKDTGTDTRKTQDRILKDIDALLNQDDPPPKPDQNKDQDKNPDMNKDMKPKDKDQEPKDKDQEPKDKDMKGGMGDPPPPKMKDNEPMGGMGNGMEQPMGGDQPKERRPRQGDNSAKEKEEPKDPGMKEPGAGGKQPKPDTKAGKPKDSKTGGKLPDPMGDKPQPPGTPVLPFEDDTPKEAWGHLPDKLRQQATQYYKQEFMPRYAELLKHYYSSDKK